MVQDNQQLLGSFILHIPVAIAILDREMHYLAVSDRSFSPPTVLFK